MDGSGHRGLSGALPGTASFRRFVEMKDPPGWNPEGLRGADGNRNHDLFDANEALYQLSYSPVDVVLLRRTTSATIVLPLPKCKSASSRRRRTLIYGDRELSPINRGIGL